MRAFALTTFLGIVVVNLLAMSARRACLIAAFLGWSAVLGLASEELSRVWLGPNMSVRQRAAAVDRAFTNGTPVPLVVAALGTNYTRAGSSARLWMGPGSAPRNTSWLRYGFGDQSVDIHTTAGIAEDPLTGTFTGAGYTYTVPLGASTATSNKIWIGDAEGVHSVGTETNRTSAAAGSGR